MFRGQILTSREVDAALQMRFAVLSGDRNPMHVDEVAARRTHAGAAVVHGVHSLLWVMESLVALGKPTGHILRVRARFLKWIYLGQRADVVLDEHSPEFISLVVEVQGMPVLTVDIYLGDKLPMQLKGTLVASPDSPRMAAANLSFDDLQGYSGDAYAPHADAARAFFPALCYELGASTVGEIVSCSYIVGMEAPGLNSTFSKLDLSFFSVVNKADRIALFFRVSYIDERFRKVRISVLGQGVEGTLDTFVRVPPVQQPSIEVITKSVDASEFASMNALVIGGSRGLGELAAKIICAGGGKVTLSYVIGKVEAERVTKEVSDWGGNADSLHYDVRKPPGPQLKTMLSPFTHLFYFATNLIFKPKSQLLSAQVLADFTVFYIQGFYDLCLELLKKAESGPESKNVLKAFYPSTIFIEERPAGMTEYGMIKAAGEQMCRDMNQYLPGLQVVQTRLPRLATDQTAGVLPERTLDAIQVMLPIVRKMR